MLIAMPITQVHRRNRMGSIDGSYTNPPPHESIQELTKELKTPAIQKPLSWWQRIRKFWNGI